jgi:F-type H+-transporting ATPase subunit gamma
MANLKEIRTRIASVKSTKQITSAMKMVAASKLRRAQDNILRLRPYANKLHSLLEHIAEVSDASDDNIYARDTEDLKNVLLIIVSSNKGLCGAFNSNVAKMAVAAAQNEYGRLLKKGGVDFMTIGKKAGDFLKAKKFTVAESENHVLDHLTFENVKKIAEKLMLDFKEKKYDRIVIFYNRFKNAATQILTQEQFLPVEVKESDKHEFKQDYIFEPSKEYLIETLIPSTLKINLFKAVLDSYAAEQGARMTAMHQATDNATSLIKDLTLNYNKARQSSITNEILEIVSGANALKS